MGRKVTKNERIFEICLFAMILVVVGYLVLGELLLPSEDQMGRVEVTDISSGWSYTYNDTEKIVDLPVNERESKGQKLTLEKKLEVGEIAGRVLCFWNQGNTLEVYVNDELRTSYDTKDSRWFGGTSPFLYIVVPLKETDAGATLHIEMQIRNTKIEKILVGDRFSLLLYICRGYIAEIVFTIGIVSLAIVCLLLSTLLRLKNIRIPQIEYFSLGTIITSIWIITNSAIRQFIFPNVSVVSDIAFFSFALFPMIFAAAINMVQRRRYEKWYLTARIVAILAFWLMVTGYWFRFADIPKTELLVMASHGFNAGVVLCTVLYDCYTGVIKNYRIMAMGSAGLAAFGVLQAVMYMTVDDVYTGILVEIGLSFGLVCTIVSGVMELVNMNNEKNQAILANRARGDFLANMSHEIRTPINAILGMDDMILRETNEEAVLEYAENIKAAGNSLLSLINDILDFSKIDSGKMDINPVKYRVSDILKDITHLLGERANEKKLDFRVEADPHMINCLYGDDVRLRQIMTNLLTNAIKYTDKGSVTLRVDATRIGGNEVMLQVAVSDTGIGIKKEDMGKLTDAFRRVDEKRNRNVEGTGLGLSITAKLLQMMDSELVIESTYGKGSTFSFALKQRITDFEEVGELQKQGADLNARKKYEESFVAPQVKILAVDDTRMNLKVFCALLKKTQVQITCAFGGKEALEYVYKEKFDLIFMDHMMPEMDGIEVLHIMKKWKEYPNKDTKVIVLTANALAGAVDMYKQEGFDDVLFKPVEGKALEQMIMKYIQV